MTEKLQNIENNYLSLGKAISVFIAIGTMIWMASSYYTKFGFVERQIDKLQNQVSENPQRKEFDDLAKKVDELGKAVQEIPKQTIELLTAKYEKTTVSGR